MDRRRSLGFVPIKLPDSVCNNLFSIGSDDKRSLMSPMTELSVNLELSSMSTPRRRLSLSENGTPTPQRANSVTESIESGIGSPLADIQGMESPLTLCPDFDSPTIENIRARKGSTSSANSFNMRRRIMARRSFSSPAMARKPLEPLNFNDQNSPQNSPFKPIINNAEENHSDLSMCEMSDQFPELDDCKFQLKRKYVGRSNSAPPDVFDDVQYHNFESQLSKGSDDDGFFDELSKDSECMNSNLSSSVPTNLMGLMAGPIVSKEFPEEDKENCAPQPVFRKPIGVPIRKTRSKSFSIKRDNPCENSPSPVSRKKRQRFVRSQSTLDVNTLAPVQKILTAPLPSRGLFRSQSFDTHVTKSPSVDITSLFDMDNKNLIGDKTKEYCLPTLESKHPDLKGISPETLASVMDGDYKHMIDEVFIIDSRYPYEYEGGHVKGALNIYEKQELVLHFLQNPKCNPDKRQIFVFHCEFSSKRGPAMCRFLRNQDRDVHQNCYPKLYYPEMYLLEGGYKEFFANRKTYCQPEVYREMLDPQFSHELKKFSKRSKSWSEDKSMRRRTGLRY